MRNIVTWACLGRLFMQPAGFSHWYISLDDIPGFAPGGIGGKNMITVLDFTVIILVKYHCIYTWSQGVVKASRLPITSTGSTGSLPSPCPPGCLGRFRNRPSWHGGAASSVQISVCCGTFFTPIPWGFHDPIWLLHIFRMSGKNPPTSERYISEVLKVRPGLFA